MEPAAIIKIIFNNLIDAEDTTAEFDKLIRYLDAGEFYVESKHASFMNDVKDSLSGKDINIYWFVPISVSGEEDDIDISGLGSRKMFYKAKENKYSPVTININYTTSKITFIEESTGLMRQFVLER